MAPNSFETGSEILCWHLAWHLFKMKGTKGRLSLRTIADCKEQTRCLGSLVLLSRESMMVGKVQTLPTAQHELHRCSLLCSILAKSVAPGFCRVSGCCSGDPSLVVFKNPGVLKRSDFICLHSKQFLGLPAKPLQPKGNTSCQITEGIAVKKEPTRCHSHKKAHSANAFAKWEWLLGVMAMM